jgi:hypothetical protein
MKKSISRVLLIILSLFVLLTPILSGAAASPREKGNYVEIKYSGKTTKEKRPPYIIQFKTLDFTSPFPGGYQTLRISIDGKKDTINSANFDTQNSIQGGGWKFNINLDYFFLYQDYAIPQFTLVTPVIDHQISTGSGEATVTNMAGKSGEENIDPLTQEREKQEKKKKDKERAAQKAKKLSKMTEEERKKELAKEKSQPPKDAYKASFTIQGSGVQMPGSQLEATVYAEFPINQYYQLDPDEFNEGHGLYLGNIDYKIDFTINEKDHVKGTLTFTDANGYPRKNDLEGFLTCESEVVTKQKISMSFPVWGTWTNGDVYAAVPKIMSDYEKRQNQLKARASDPSAKVDTVTYNNGRWIMLKKGPKKLNKGDLEVTNEHYSYLALEITDKFIYYETGVINFPPGTALKLIPEVKYRFPHDRGNNMDLYSKPLSEYAVGLEPTLFGLKYNSYNDTILATKGFFPGTTLRRVKEAPITATWSSIKDVEKPNPASVRDKAGTWYEFKLEKGAYADGEYTPSVAGGYTYERVTVNNDGSAEVISGRAEIYGFDDTLHCYIKNKTVYSKDGKKEETEYKPDIDEDGEEDIDFEYDSFTVRYSDFDRSAGTIKFNNSEFYKVTKAELNGSWSTSDTAPPTPDTSKADARAALMAAYPGGIEWLKFDSPSRTFIRVLWAEYNGKMHLLIEKGSYSTFGGNQIELDGITGTCYSAENVLLYENVPDPYGTETLVYRTDPDNANVMDVGGIGKMYKAK